MDIVAQQFLRALRGRRSQQSFARRLGYKANPITDWEHGRSYPYATEALRAAQLGGVDVVAAFSRFSPNVPLETKRGKWLLGPWMRAILGDTSVSDLSRQMEYSRSSISRWVCGSSEPRVPQFLAFVECATGRVADLVAELVTIEAVPGLLPRYQAARAAKHVAFTHPWTEALLRILESEPYTSGPPHDDERLARQLGIDVALVRAGLAALAEAQVVERVGARYEVVSQLTVDTGGGKKALHALKAHWAEVAAERAARPRRGDVFGYNVLSASTSDLERIRDVLKNAYREVRAIVAASEPSQCVALVNVQLATWESDDESRASLAQ